MPNLLQVISDVEVTQLVAMIRQYGMEFKEALVYDRIREELRIFCANHTIDEVYNTMFLVRFFLLTVLPEIFGKTLATGEGEKSFDHLPPPSDCCYVPWESVYFRDPHHTFVSISLASFLPLPLSPGGKSK